MRRDVETFKASRNRVNSKSTVGNTLNSTGRPMYIATIMTMTDIMRSITIKQSIIKLGRGGMSEMTINSTAIATASSPALDSPAGFSGLAATGTVAARICAIAQAQTSRDLNLE